VRTSTVRAKNFGSSRFQTGSNSRGTNAGNSGMDLQAYALGRLSLDDKKYIGDVIGTDNSFSGSNENGFWNLDTTGIENRN
jgi:hypothetical protein